MDWPRQFVTAAAASFSLPVGDQLNKGSRQRPHGARSASGCPWPALVSCWSMTSAMDCPSSPRHSPPRLSLADYGHHCGEGSYRLSLSAAASRLAAYASDQTNLPPGPKPVRRDRTSICSFARSMVRNPIPSAAALALMTPCSTGSVSQDLGEERRCPFQLRALD